MVRAVSVVFHDLQRALRISLVRSRTAPRLRAGAREPLWKFRLPRPCLSVGRQDLASMDPTTRLPYSNNRDVWYATSSPKSRNVRRSHSMLYIHL